MWLGTLIFAAAAIYVVVQAFFAIIAGMSPEMTPEESVALGVLLSPEWRFLLAAVVASVVSQLVDTEIYTRWLDRFGAEKQWGRVLVSNVISIPLDRVLFLLIGFAGSMSSDLLWEFFFGTTIVRLIFGIISIPGIYLVEEHSQDWVKMSGITHTDPPSFCPIGERVNRWRLLSLDTAGPRQPAAAIGRRRSHNAGSSKTPAPGMSAMLGSAQLPIAIPAHQQAVGISHALDAPAALAIRIALGTAIAGIKGQLGVAVTQRVAALIGLAAGAGIHFRRAAIWASLRSPAAISPLKRFK